MHRVWAGFQELSHPGPKLSCGESTKEKTVLLLQEVIVAGDLDRKFTLNC